MRTCQVRYETNHHHIKIKQRLVWAANESCDLLKERVRIRCGSLRQYAFLSQHGSHVGADPSCSPVLVDHHGLELQPFTVSRDLEAYFLVLWVFWDRLMTFPLPQLFCANSTSVILGFPARAVLKEQARVTTTQPSMQP